MSIKHDDGAERVRRHFEKPQTELHKGGRSKGERALIAGAVVAGGLLTAPIWAPVVVGAAYVAIVTLTVTAAVAVATAPVWAPLAVIGWAAHKAYKASKGKNAAATQAATQAAQPRDVVQPVRHDARRVTDNQPPRAERRRAILVDQTARESAPPVLRPRRGRAMALPRP